jgi:hypothetical protein
VRLPAVSVEPSGEDVSIFANFHRIFLQRVVSLIKTVCSKLCCQINFSVFYIPSENCYSILAVINNVSNFTVMRLLFGYANVRPRKFYEE